MRKFASYVVATILAVIAVSVSSCHTRATHDPAAHPTSIDAPLITGEPMAINTQDKAFANTMLAHYRRASDVSALVPDRSTNFDIVAFAAAMPAGQQPTVETLKAFLVQWDQGGDASPAAPALPSAKGDIDDATIERLRALRGTEFDTLWVASMVASDQGALDVASTELTTGKNVDAISLTKQIVAALTAEIAQLRQFAG